jgi:hypothetical protein
MSRPSYVSDDQYHRVVDALAHAGHMDRDEVIFILGEIGNIWPRSILLESVTQAAKAEIVSMRR